MLEEAVFGLLVLGCLAFIVRANVWYWRRMAAMVPEDRATEDAEDQREANIW